MLSINRLDSDRSIITHVSRERRKRHFSFFFFLFIFFSPNRNPAPFVSSPPSFSFSILFYPKLRRRNPLLRNRSNDFYVIKKYFRLSIFILITSQRTFKWETKIISFVYLPRLGVIAVIASIFCCSFSIDIVSRLWRKNSNDLRNLER